MQETPTTSACSASDFADWIEKNPPGSSIVWHVGFLARERRAWPGNPKPIAGLDKLARAVAKAAAEGSVSLVQRRIAEGVYEYVAVRSAPPAARMRGYACGRRNIVLHAKQMLQVDVPNTSRKPATATPKQPKGLHNENLAVSA